MRKILFASGALVALAAAYVGYPFFTAWSIREAIRNGNASYLESKIEWDGVRESLRQSLTAIALDQVAPGPGDGAQSDAAPRGLWQRIKARVGKSAVDRLVDAYVTPEGLPQLFSYRTMYRTHVSGEADESQTLPWHRRVARFWSRVKRAEFKTATAFEIEMEDRNDASRRYIGLLRLSGLEWKLTRLSVRLVQTASPIMPAGSG